MWLEETTRNRQKWSAESPFGAGEGRIGGQMICRKPLSKYAGKEKLAAQTLDQHAHTPGCVCLLGNFSIQPTQAHQNVKKSLYMHGVCRG